jgi:signal transduction histidine kinase
VKVHVRQGDAALDVEIVNDAAKQAPAAIPGSGVGLIGMRERVTLFGGALLTGPAKNGGFKVVARFPLSAAP